MIFLTSEDVTCPSLAITDLHSQSPRAVHEAARETVPITLDEQDRLYPIPANHLVICGIDTIMRL